MRGRATSRLAWSLWCLAVLFAATGVMLGRATVRLRREDGDLAFEVEDDGRGFDPDVTPRGSGLQNMLDRLEALGGRLDIRSAPGHGSTVTGSVPATEREPVA